MASLNDKQGSLITNGATIHTTPSSIKSGNWNYPTVWSTCIVPLTVSEVIVQLSIVINVHDTCKTLKAESSAQVQAAAGKKLTILQ